MFGVGDEIICKELEKGVYVYLNEVVTVVFWSNVIEQFDLTIRRPNGSIQYCNSKNFELYRKNS